MDFLLISWMYAIHPKLNSGYWHSLRCRLNFLLLYINDVHFCSETLFVFFFFEDDTNILYALKKFNEIHLDLIYKRRRFLLLAQRYGTRCQKARSRLLKKLKKHAKEYLQKRLKGALLNILKTEENYTENYKIMANLKKNIYLYLLYIHADWNLQ